MSAKLPIGSGMARAKRNRSRGPRAKNATLDVCPFCGVKAPHKHETQVKWALPPELPDDDTTVLLAFEDGEPELGFRSDGRWWRTHDASPIGHVPTAWCHVPFPPQSLVDRAAFLTLAAVRAAAKPLRKTSIIGGVH